MALRFDTATSAGDNTNVSSVSFSHTASADTRALVALPAIKENTDANRDITDVTWAGASITALREDDNAAQATRLRTEVWYRLSPTTGTQTAVFTAAGVCDELSGGVMTLTDDVGEPTIDAHNGATGSSAAPSVTVTTVTDQAALVGVMMTDSGLPGQVSVTVGAERWETDLGAQIQSGASDVDLTPPGDYALTWDTPNNPFAISAVAVAPAQAAAGWGLLMGHTRNRAVLVG